MKKKILVIGMIAVLALAMTACKEENPKEEYAGTYELTEMVIDGQTLTTDQLKTLMSVEEVGGVTLTDDGKYTLNMLGEVGSGKWTLTEKGQVIMDKGKDAEVKPEFNKSKDTFTATINQTKCTFVKKAEEGSSN